MKRTTISLPDELAAALERDARRRRISVSEAARRALAAHLGFADDARRQLTFSALGRSGHHDTADRIEELLATEWHPDRDR